MPIFCVVSGADQPNIDPIPQQPIAITGYTPTLMMP